MGAVRTAEVAAVTAAPVPTVALTTTFTPPAECGEKHLTMLVGALEKIWINEPAPLPNTTISSCYPTQWVDGYTSVMSASSSIAPFMSPLVCPSGWNTESSTWSSGYIACCASYVFFYLFYFYSHSYPYFCPTRPCFDM